MSFDVKVRKTGAQKEISGLQSNEAILTMTMTADRHRRQQQSGTMAITNDMWMVPGDPRLRPGARLLQAHGEEDGRLQHHRR